VKNSYRRIFISKCEMKKDVIRDNYINLYEVMRPKNFERSNNLFKQQFLMHLTYVLCKIRIVEYSYQSFN
jgi:hypothetical protein